VVFEHLFPDALLEKKEWSAFVLAVIYSTISIIIARLLFPANSGLVAVVFVSIFLIPYFKKMLKREELQEESDTDKTLFGLFQDNWDIIKIYFLIFFGIYLTFMFYSFLAPFLGYDVSAVFREQLSLEVVRGGAVFSPITFWEIFMNNWWVLLACFLVALVAGDGAIFFIAWNASTWGTIFGYRAVAASSVSGESALFSLLIIVAITLPHVILESFAYITAAIAGGVISDEVVERLDEIRSFVLYFLTAVMVYVIVLLVSSMLLRAWPVMHGLVSVVVALVILHVMRYLFSDAWHRRVFTYNFYLFVFAICVFIAGALLETFVLYNATPLLRVYAAAAMVG